MAEGGPRQFSTPEQEIEYLRNQIAQRERELLERTPAIDNSDIETVGKQEIKQYMSFTPKMVLEKNYELQGSELVQAVESVSISHNPVEDILQIALEKGIKNALTVLEKSDNAFIIDEVHRRLIEQIKNGIQIADLKEGQPVWHVLHMTLYEIALPAQKESGEGTQALANLAGAMQQLFSGLRTIGSAKPGNHYVIEVSIADNSDDIVVYVAVPNEFTALFEKQTLALFPQAVLTIKPNDYNIFVDKGTTMATEVGLSKHPIYPLKMHEDFSSDPFAVILNAFSKIEREGGGAAIQFVIRHPKNDYRGAYQKIIKDVEKGMKPSEAISRSTLLGDFKSTLSDALFKSDAAKKHEESNRQVDATALEVFKKKINTEIVEANIRMVVSAKEPARANQILLEIESTLNQFAAVDGNSITLRRVSGAALARMEKAFSFRELDTKAILPLSLGELSTLFHFPNSGMDSTPQFKQSTAKTAPVQNDMPTQGTALGINKHRAMEKPVFITELDRMRHFYIIGQTGTGKSKFLTNLIIQDIQAGAGVCMIDPHGTDIEDVLGAIPPEREGDIIYFDPSYMDRVIGLNMLEYDVTKPEQKTFVVNELFAIFKKLYTAESMGPMFEQYFRNSTMLVMEDPESGSTLMDIGRVMADASFRRKKLEKATNPTVVQFWKEIATKASGEQSLENFVPYITSKFDVFTANDYMRPIIGQQQSAFNFRKLMDERKILLVNLSKGRLGEINANLIGMIFVGKILMAALSRVDDPTRSFPPFYLHIDEFQNISTDAISSILSEARKYKLGMSMAHQFIAQLEQGIRDAVFGNVGSMAVFRVGNEDAQVLEKQMEPVFNAHDIMNIPNYNAYLKVLANGVPTQPFSVATLPPIKSDPVRAAYLRDMSLQRYGRPRAEVEEEIRLRYQKSAPPIPPLPPLG